MVTRYGRYKQGEEVSLRSRAVAFARQLLLQKPKKLNPTLVSILLLPSAVLGPLGKPWKGLMHDLKESLLECQSKLCFSCWTNLKHDNGSCILARVHELVKVSQGRSD